MLQVAYCLRLGHLLVHVKNCFAKLVFVLLACSNNHNERQNPGLIDTDKGCWMDPQLQKCFPPATGWEATGSGCSVRWPDLSRSSVQFFSSVCMVARNRKLQVVLSGTVLAPHPTKAPTLSLSYVHTDGLFELCWHKQLLLQNQIF